MASALLLAFLLHLARLSINPLGPGTLIYAALLGTALGLGLICRRSARPAVAAVGTFALDCATMTAIVVMGATASYPMAALSHGFSDAALQAIDRALGFDWIAWYRLVAAHPALQALGIAAYRSIYITPAVLLAHFAFAGDRAGAHRFLASFWVAAVFTLLLYPLMPAIGPFSYLWHGAIAYMPESEMWQQGLIPALRAGTVSVVDLGHLRGIVSAPSFHSAAALLYIAAAWPLRPLRWGMLAVNVAMLLSTPVEGTHYLVDILLGLTVACVALAFVRVLERMGKRDASSYPSAILSPS